MSYRLGIDTGGTFTDAVLIDEQQRVSASTKQLTTRHDLTVGIGHALENLPPEQLQCVELVALSTTLSTNSVVEGRGAPICVLLAGYSDEHVARSGLNHVLGSDPVIQLEGGHDSQGREVRPLDEASAQAHILRHAESVSAFAISAMFGTRNPVHERRLRELVFELTGKPVTCGHELADSLGAPRRALTVALNARMIPTIHRLVFAMETMLKERAIDAPLMLVKGDGSLISVETALREPVGTVLSGPAASVIGACAASGIEDAIVADMGGTTTDIAVVSGGRPKLSHQGVRIGDLQPMVEAIKVVAIGLGGDSEVRFGGRGEIVIGPRRVVPMSLLASQHAGVIEQMQRQLGEAPDRRHNRFALKLESSPEHLVRLNDIEREAWASLESGPVSLADLMRESSRHGRAMARLERMGLAIYSGFTPSDAAHVLGRNTHWNSEAAEIAAQSWARQMRHIYGIGQWLPGDIESPCKRIFEVVTRRIECALTEAGLNEQDLLSEARARGLAEFLTDAFRASVDSSELITVGFNPGYRLVAVGAPAPVFYPPVAQGLGLPLTLPEHGAVANALGAAIGSVVQRAHVTITQPRDGVFLVHSDQAPVRFNDLHSAQRCAEEQAMAEAKARASAAGADEIELVVSEASNQVHDEVDGDLFLEKRITVTASGRPRLAG